MGAMQPARYFPKWDGPKRPPEKPAGVLIGFDLRKLGPFSIRISEFERTGRLDRHEPLQGKRGKPQRWRQWRWGRHNCLKPLPKDRVAESSYPTYLRLDRIVIGGRDDGLFRWSHSLHRILVPSEKHAHRKLFTQVRALMVNL